MVGIKRTLAIAMTVVVVIVVGSHAYAEELKGAQEYSVADPWRFESTLYLWLPGIKGTIGVGGMTAPVDASIGDILDNFQFGFLGRVEAWKGNWGGFLDGMYVKLGDDIPAGGPIASGDFTTQQGIIEFGAMYRLPEVTFGSADEQTLIFDLIAAGRYFTLSQELNLTGAGPIGMFRSGSVSQDWAEPYFGGRVAWNNLFGWTEALSIGVRADVGGFGVGSNLTWSVLAGLDYRVSRLISLRFGYRWLDVDFDSGGSTPLFVFDVQMSGPVLGLTFHF